MTCWPERIQILDRGKEWRKKVRYLHIQGHQRQTWGRSHLMRIQGLAHLCSCSLLSQTTCTCSHSEAGKTRQNSHPSSGRVQHSSKPSQCSKKRFQAGHFHGCTLHWIYSPQAQTWWVVRSGRSRWSRYSQWLVHRLSDGSNYYKGKMVKPTFHVTWNSLVCTANTSSKAKEKWNFCSRSKAC